MFITPGSLVLTKIEHLMSCTTTIVPGYRFGTKWRTFYPHVSAINTPEDIDRNIDTDFNDLPVSHLKQPGLYTKHDLDTLRNQML